MSSKLIGFGEIQGGLFSPRSACVKNMGDSWFVSTQVPENQLGIEADEILEQSSPSVTTLKNARITILKISDTDIEFGVSGVNCAVINTIRRILLAEVPTIAIEKVLVENNTSLIHDEILANRLGLIPLDVNPEELEMPLEGVGIRENEKNTIVFELNVKCTKNPNSPNSTKDPNILYNNSTVYSNMLKWVPLGDQSKKFNSRPPKPIHGDIIIAKLRPGQEIILRAICRKGVGSDHAKFSPCATAWYRNIPRITLKERIFGDLASNLKTYLPEAIDLVKSQDGNGLEALVKTSCPSLINRNVMYDNELKNLLEIGHEPDRFIFTVESLGSYSPEKLVSKAFQIAANRCQSHIHDLEEALE